MRRLEMDYQKSVERPSKTAGWLLLLIGIALLIEMGMSYDRLHNDKEATSREIRTAKIHMDMPQKQKESTGYKFTDKDFAEARQIVNRLSNPWDELLAGLESVNNENVAILSIEPDMQTRLLRIEGEAKDYAAALTLVAQLRTTKPFSDVFLLRHEIKRDDPQHPVGFTLSLRWLKPS